MSKKEQYIYKIKDNDTGLYSKGGGNVQFGKLGKVWTSKGALKNHLSLIRNSDEIQRNKYKNCQIMKIPLSAEEFDQETTIELEKIILERA